MAATSIALGMSNAVWPVAMVAVVAVLAGVAGGGWLGVCLSECARLAPSDQVGLVTGGVLFFHYLTLIITPLAFAAFAARLGYGSGLHRGGRGHGLRPAAAGAEAPAEAAA